MIPYVHNILPALYDMGNPSLANIEWQNLKSTLQTFVVVTFNINVFRPQLRESDLITGVLQVPQILTHVTMIELLVKLSVNIDFVSSSHKDAILTQLQSAFHELSPDNQDRLKRRLTSEQRMRLPFAKSNKKSVQALSFCLDASANTATQQKGKKCRKGKNRRARKKKLFAMQRANKAAARPAPEEHYDEEEDSDEDDDVPDLVAEAIPEKGVCELSGGLMVDPVQTPDGHLFDRAALEDWVRHEATNPITGTPLTISQCNAAVDVQESIRGYQMQMLSACEIAPEVFEPEAQRGPSLLGTLPSLSAPEQKPKKEKSKIRITSRSVVDCPEEMRCAVDGKVMVNPVRSPAGLVFEQKTLKRWMDNCGSVCPITGEPLRLEDCITDQAMKKTIVQFLKGKQD